MFHVSSLPLCFDAIADDVSCSAVIVGDGVTCKSAREWVLAFLVCCGRVLGSDSAKQTHAAYYVVLLMTTGPGVSSEEGESLKPRVQAREAMALHLAVVSSE